MIELLREKLKQIRDAQDAFELLVVDFGRSQRKFADGEVVKVKQSGRKATIKSASYGYSKFGGDFNLMVDYNVAIKTGGNISYKRFTESQLEKIL